MVHNSELLFSLDAVEGIGAFSFGIGTWATFPCGKSEISNMVTKPRVNPTQVSFDTYDNNVFSNGQVDVFFDKCYQQRNGWVFMDGQGKVSRSVIRSVMLLTNVVFIHYSSKDFRQNQAFDELTDTVKEIRAGDKNVKVCILLRDAGETKQVLKAEFPA